MESPHSVNSPRRILSLSKHHVSFHDPDDKTGFGLFGEYGLTPSEVYGFVRSITVVVASDKFSRNPSCIYPSVEGDEKAIKSMSDISIDRINDSMFDATS